jgi:hypothetical protein
MRPTVSSLARIVWVKVLRRPSTTPARGSAGILKRSLMPGTSSRSGGRRPSNRVPTGVRSVIVMVRVTGSPTATSVGLALTSMLNRPTAPVNDGGRPSRGGGMTSMAVCSIVATTGRVRETCQSLSKKERRRCSSRGYRTTIRTSSNVSTPACWGVIRVRSMYT